MADQTWDVFISYAHKDADWVQNLADNLYRADFEVFIDSWEIAPGDVLVHKIDEGILKSKTGILVVSPEALSRPWVLEEYAAMMNRAVEGKQRLIPVLLADAEMPPLLATRVWIDFRNAYGPEYDRNFAELALTLKGERPARPKRNGSVSLPADDPFRPEGPIYRILQISKEKVAFLGGWKQASHKPRRLRFEDEQRIYELKAMQRKSFSESDYNARSEAALDGSKPQTDDTAYGKLLAAGAALTGSFLSGEAGSALRQAIKEASSLNASLRLALEIVDDDLADLPWETLRIPEGGGQLGDPLALHSKIQFYRSVSGLGAAPAVQIPGPLRILVAIGSPEAQNSRGELLDMERETERILDAVQTARDEGKVYVRILETGSVNAINAALSAQRYHVLHISCHAEPGNLILEKENGDEDPVSASRLSDQALPADRSPNLVVLAGCSTGIGATDGEAQLAPIARGLLERGIPAIIAMQTPVSDRYATEYGAELYRYLSTSQIPDPLSAASNARLSVEKVREAEENQFKKRALTEWATPALYLRGPSLPLYDPDQEFEKISPTVVPVFSEGVCVRSVGDFIGRRRPQRIILNALRKKDSAGVLIHGIGGCGKSSLAAQIFHRLVEDGWFLVSLTGPMTVEAVLGQMSQRFLTQCITQGWDEKHPLRQVAGMLKQSDLELEQRFALLSEIVLSQLKLAILLDNFEDNLTEDHAIINEGPQRDLGVLLSRWIQNPGKSRLVFTSRYPFKLPSEAVERLLHWHLGPLSFSETRKLVLRLPGFDVLKPYELRQAYVNVGGHPRALEYLDALMRGGKARFIDVEQRLKKAILKNKKIEDPNQLCSDMKGDFDRALAETITLAADDVLIDELLERLEESPLALDLLYGASIYRLPVDQSGLAWQINEEIELPDDPKRTSRIKQINEKIAEVLGSGREPSIETLGISPEQLQQYQQDINEAQRPPLSISEGFSSAMDELLENSLLSIVQYAEDDPLNFIVHRWTANALQRRMSAELANQRHLRAGRYWDWRVDTISKSLTECLEARYHFYQTDDLKKALDITYKICDQLHTWGSWQQEEALYRESLALLPERSQNSATLMHKLGIIAYVRGAYDEALEWYRKALGINEKLGNRVGMADSYHTLGAVANARGAYDEALEWYRKALDIFEDLGNRAKMANSYHQMGIVVHLRGAYDEALEWYRKALDIFEDLGNRAEMASSYHNLGAVANARGAYDEALEWYRKALDIREELGDRAGMAGSYHQMGMVAHARDAYDEALEWYRKALDIKEELGDRAGIANSYHNLGAVAKACGAYDEALEWYRKSLDIAEELGDRAGMAISYHEKGNVAYLKDAYDEALEWYRKALDIREELGDRAGMAGSYHNLGAVANARGAYDEALEWYRKALDIREELGDRAGAAESMSAIGNLLIDLEKPGEAISLHLMSLITRVELDVPQAINNIQALEKVRERINDKEFRQAIEKELEPDDAQYLFDLFEKLKEPKKNE